jgi:hypothetical protein
VLHCPMLLLSVRAVLCQTLDRQTLEPLIVPQQYSPDARPVENVFWVCP